MSKAKPGPKWTVFNVNSFTGHQNGKPDSSLNYTTARKVAKPRESWLEVKHRAAHWKGLSALCTWIPLVFMSFYNTSLLHINDPMLDSLLLCILVIFPPLLSLDADCNHTVSISDFCTACYPKVNIGSKHVYKELTTAHLETVFSENIQVCASHWKVVEVHVTSQFLWVFCVLNDRFGALVELWGRKVMFGWFWV